MIGCAAPERVLRSAAVLLAVMVGSAAAQGRRAAVDVVASTDGVRGSTPRRDVGVSLDAFGAVRLADGLDIVSRPLLVRRTFDGAWRPTMYQLGLRYERRSPQSGGIGMRLEAGQLPSPIGIGILANRADLNPVVSQHSAYYLPLPRVDQHIPRVFLISASSPVGALATVSGRSWDARVAVLDSSPVRGRPLFAPGPPRLLNGVVGFGVTPKIGLRLGVALARGAYVAAREVGGSADQMARVLQAEGEWSFGHTRVAGEIVHSRLDAPRGPGVAMGGWADVAYTLAPRAYVAGRVDYQSFDYRRVLGERVASQWYARAEAIAGFRLTPEITLKAGYMVRRGYVVWHWDDQVIGSIVWQRKVW
jgi:hypothetical protein